VEVVCPDLLQFHGSEDDAFCAGFGRPFLKSVPMRGLNDVAAFTRGYPSAAGFVFDGHGAGEAGGGGRSFDWSRELSRGSRQVAVLAGGLNDDNVGDAIRRVRPFAVDVSSGIESPGWPGIKHSEKMRRFIDEARWADQDD